MRGTNTAKLARSGEIIVKLEETKLFLEEKNFAKNVSEDLINAFNAEKDFTKVEGVLAENHKSLTAL